MNGYRVGLRPSPAGPGTGNGMKRLAPSGMLLAVVVVWGWTFVLVKDAVAEYGVVSFLAVRFAIGTLAVGVFCGRRLNRRSLKAGGAIGLVIAAAYLFQTFGLRHTTVTNSGLITGLFIVFVPASSRLLFGVRTGLALWAAIGASVIGLAFLAGSAPQGIALGDVLTLGAAACFGLHVALLDRHSKRHDASVLALGQLASATLVFSAACPVVESIAWPTPKVWFAILVTGVLATAVASYVQTHVQRRLPAVPTAMIIMTEPIFAAIFGYVLAGDRLTPLQLAGAGVMTCSVFFTQVYLALRKPAGVAAGTSGSALGRTEGAADAGGAS